MELSTLGLKDRAQWEAKGYQLPQFDRAAVTEGNQRKSVLDSLWCRKYFPCISGKCNAEYLKQREMETGLIVAEGFDYEIIEK